MKKIALIVLLFSQSLYGQNDPYTQLQQQLAAEKTPGGKFNILKSLVDMAFYQNLNTALAYAQQGVMAAGDDTAWQPFFCEMEGKMHSYLLHFDSAKLLLRKAIDGYHRANNKTSEARALFRLSWVLKRSGAKEKAMDEDLKALRLMEQQDDKNGIAMAYEHISDGLSRQERDSVALEYAWRSIELCEQYNLRIQRSYSFFNLANVYLAIGKKDSALQYYNKAVETGRALNLDPVSLIHAIVGRGNALKRLQRYKEALEEYNYVLDAAKKLNYVNAIAVAIANLGEVNLLLGNYDQAIVYQLETVRLQERDSAFFNLTENYSHVASIYEKMGNYQKALEFERKSRAMRDRVASAESDEAMSRMLTQYQTEKKEATIATQQKEITQQKKVRWLSTGVAVLMAGFLIVGYRSLRNRNRSNKLLAAKNAENELLLKEIHHRVKNNLEVVSSLLALQSAQIDDANTREAMLEGQNRVHSIGIVHQKLYQGETLGSIEMKDYFLNLSESILDSFGAEKRVSIELAMEKLNVDIDTAVPLGLIVNELLTNTLKYAFPNQQQGSVRIKLEKQPDNMLYLEVSDNGIGKSGVTAGTGFGSQLISLLTRQLNGSMKEEVINGTTVYFDFKMEKTA